MNEALNYNAIGYTLHNFDADAYEFPNLPYWLIFLSYLAVALANVVRLDLAYATRTDNPSMKIGLRTVAFGAMVGLGYVANESLYVVGRRIGLGYPFGDKDMVTIAQRRAK